MTSQTHTALLPGTPLLASVKLQPGAALMVESRPWNRFSFSFSLSLSRSLPPSLSEEAAWEINASLTQHEKDRCFSPPGEILAITDSPKPATWGWCPGAPLSGCSTRRLSQSLLALLLLASVVDLKVFQRKQSSRWKRTGWKNDHR